jgi:histidinol-phosphatase (PHP family)
MLTTDYHIHTSFSHDSQAPLLEMCRAAAARGMTEICITEHLDFDRSDLDYSELDWDAYAAAVAEACSLYAGRMTIRIGVEFAIGSVHSSAGCPLFRLRKGVPAGFDIRRVLAEYFDEVEALAATGWCHVLGHFEYLYKQIPAIVGPVRDDWYWQKVDGILRQCIASGVGIEANMHHTLDGCAMAADLEILHRYRALGGRLVTVGSDAHRPEEVAGDFGRAEETLRTAGFDQVCGYQGGRPYFVPIGR